MRPLYQLTVWMHPPGFRRRFGGELLSIFDEQRCGSQRGALISGASLVVDSLLSLVRQWIMRTDCWKICVALGGAFVQVWGFGYPTRGHQSWTMNRQTVTPYLEETILITLASLCSLLIAILLLSAWAMRFQRRRLTGRRAHVSSSATGTLLTR